MPASNTALLKEYQKALERLRPDGEGNVYKGWFKTENDIIIRMANAGYDPSELSERIFFLTQGFKDKDQRHPAERMKEILEWQSTASS